RKGDQEIAARRADVTKAQAEIDHAHAAWYRADQDYRFTKAEIDVARYDYEEALHRGEKSAAGKKGHLDQLESRWRDLRLKLEEVKAREDAANAHLRDLEKTRLDAEAKQKELLGEKSRLDDKLHKIEPGFVSFV